MTKTQKLGGLLVRKDFSRDEYARQSDKIAKEVGGRFSRGNIAGQNGFLLKAEDLEREREQLREKLRKSPAA